VSKPEIEVSEDPAGRAVELLLEAVATGGHVALSGGSTPREAYRRAAEAEADWAGTEIWFVDERCVGPDHEHSNFKMVHEALLSRIEPRAAHRMKGELGPGEGAADYEREIAGVFGQGVVPEFDLILLGLGPDGHTASLFPGNPELGIRDRNVAGVEHPGMAPLVPRITLTLPVLNAGARVAFLVTGEDKAEAAARAFSGRESPETPASLVHPRGELLVVCNAAAAAHLGAG
jgi:6-phosphogluconolactonase